MSDAVSLTFDEALLEIEQRQRNELAEKATALVAERAAAANWTLKRRTPWPSVSSVSSGWPTKTRNAAASEASRTA